MVLRVYNPNDPRHSNARPRTCKMREGAPCGYAPPTPGQSPFAGRDVPPVISLSRTHICVLKETEPKTDGPAGPTVISYRGVKDISQKVRDARKQTNKQTRDGHYSTTGGTPHIRWPYWLVLSVIISFHLFTLLTYFLNFFVDC